MNKALTEKDIYKAVSDLISENYDWLSDPNNKGASIQYILGINDLGRYLAEKTETRYGHEQVMISYNDAKVGDRVMILGTVTDVNESGVQTIRPDTDSEGYVRARKIEGKEDDHD